MKSLCFDIESNGLLDTINVIYCLCTEDTSTGEKKSYSDFDDNLPSLAEGLEELKSADRLVGHNIIGYDIPAIKIVTGLDLLDKNCHDTLIMSQALRYKRTHKHSLGAWGEKLKNAKIEYHDWSGYNQEMLVYCQQDVALNVEVYKTLISEFNVIRSINPLIATGMKVEMDAAKFNTMCREQGWNFDMDLAEKTLAQMNARMAEIEQVIEPQMGTNTVYIDKEPKTPKYKKDGTYNANTCRILSEYFGHEVNPTDTHLMAPGTEFRRSREEQVRISQVHLLKEWLENNGWKPDEYTRKKGPDGRWINVGPKLTTTSLEALGEIGKMVGEYLTIRNRRSVIEGWLEKIKDGRLSGNMFTIGTPSMRARHQGIVNLPSTSAAWGKPLREMLKADEGEVIVGCDSAGNQLRGLCHFVNNSEYTEVVRFGDQHQRNADALGISRPAAKSFLYAYLFGAGDAKLGQVITGKGNAKVGKKARDDFAKSIEGLMDVKNKFEGQWRDRALRQNQGWIHGLDGRPIFIETEHQVLNYLLQSTEGITCKASLSWAMEKIKEEGLRAKPRIWYHDEMAFSVHPDDAERVGQILKDAYEEGPKMFGVETMDGGDYCIGGSYADVH